MNLGSMRWPQLAGSARQTLLAVPLGATEQHGPHLPLHTDTTIATELCARLSEAVPDVVAAPAIPYGSSGEHAGFPGTLSIGHSALELLIVELVRSADDFAGTVLISGHGGNHEPLQAAATRLRGEGRPVLVWLPSGQNNDSHAGRTETSAMLRLRPGDVRMDAAEPGNTQPLPQLLERLRETGVAATSPNGILGDPTGAGADDGAAIIERWSCSLIEAVMAWWTERSGPPGSGTGC